MSEYSREEWHGWVMDLLQQYDPDYADDHFVDDLLNKYKSNWNEMWTKLLAKYNVPQDTGQGETGGSFSNAPLHNDKPREFAPGITFPTSLMASHVNWNNHDFWWNRVYNYLKYHKPVAANDQVVNHILSMPETSGHTYSEMWKSIRSHYGGDEDEEYDTYYAKMMRYFQAVKPVCAKKEFVEDCIEASKIREYTYKEMWADILQHFGPDPEEVRVSWIQKYLRYLHIRAPEAEKLEFVDALIAKGNSNYEQIMDQLIHRYGPEPDYVARASMHDRFMKYLQSNRPQDANEEVVEKLLQKGDTSQQGYHGVWENLLLLYGQPKNCQLWLEGSPGLGGPPRRTDEESAWWGDRLRRYFNVLKPELARPANIQAFLENGREAGYQNMWAAIIEIHGQEPDPPDDFPRFVQPWSFSNRSLVCPGSWIYLGIGPLLFDALQSPVSVLKFQQAIVYDIATTLGIERSRIRCVSTVLGNTSMERSRGQYGGIGLRIAFEIVVSDLRQVPCLQALLQRSSDRGTIKVDAAQRVCRSLDVVDDVAFKLRVVEPELSFPTESAVEQPRVTMIVKNIDAIKAPEEPAQQRFPSYSGRSSLSPPAYMPFAISRGGSVPYS
eukprot:PhF_6_TR43177/c0_g1_i2/m.66154